MSTDFFVVLIVVIAISIWVVRSVQITKHIITEIAKTDDYKRHIQLKNAQNQAKSDEHAANISKEK